VVTPLTERGANLAISHHVPLNPRLIAQPLARATRDMPVSESPAPEMVLATWRMLMEQLETAANPGIRAMARSADRSAGWKWDRFDELPSAYRQFVS
jgi:hypothetical protein